MGLFNWGSWKVTRDTGGRAFYEERKADADWSGYGNKLKMAYRHPILMPGISLIADYFSMVRFTENGKDDTDIIKLLNNPNIYQTRDDFLKQFIWFKYVCGWLYQYPVTSGAGDNVKRVKMMYNLKPSLIDFDEDFKTTLPFTLGAEKKELARQFIYDSENQNKVLTFDDIMAYYDLANGIDESRKDENWWISPSRLEAIRKPLITVQKAFDGKNIVIESNGKEMFINKTQGNMAKIPLKKQERGDLERKLGVGGKYGVSSGQTRTVISNSELEWQSLHIKLKELGLDESIIADGNVIISALGIPPELFSLSGSSSTFENQAKAVINFVQKKIQVEMNDFTNTINARYGTNLIGTYDHLPIMREIEKSKALGMKSIMSGVKQMVDAGIMTPQQANAEYYEWKDKM